MFLSNESMAFAKQQKKSFYYFNSFCAEKNFLWRFLPIFPFFLLFPRCVVYITEEVVKRTPGSCLLQKQLKSSETFFSYEFFYTNWGYLLDSLVKVSSRSMRDVLVYKLRLARSGVHFCLGCLPNSSSTLGKHSFSGSSFDKPFPL